MFNACQSIQGERHTHTGALCGLHTITFSTVLVNMSAGLLCQVISQEGAMHIMYTILYIYNSNGIIYTDLEIILPIIGRKLSERCMYDHRNSGRLHYNYNENVKQAQQKRNEQYTLAKLMPDFSIW